ncbi:hypothetical protein [Mesorhizobium sp. B2-1-2]|uniref:hypothetical protein n=1 Tax=Mesorhizobium sp. B2-1-2 TaxID=2589973 RepID=UPI00174642FE|nr:hypothetical protein [Mesorhizobium sp. B2-1-2]
MTVKTRAQINTDADTLLPDNTSAEISPADLRGRIKDLADSAAFSAELATVATSGAYGDLIGKPTLGSAAALTAGTAAGNVPVLDGSGKLAAPLLPSFVDDVLEYANLAALPGTGETGKIYVALDSNKTYRWSGSAYVEISPSPGSTDSVTEGVVNKYFTEARVRSTVMTGLSLLSSAAVIATDTVLDAIGKLQRQINDLVAMPRSSRNYLINGNGAVNQRGATSKADDSYAWDRHYVLTQTASVGVSTLVDVASRIPYMMRETQSQAAAQRMGIAQIVESANCRDLRDSNVTLLGKLRCSASQPIRYAVLEWTGTADVVVSDVVNSWTNGVYSAGQFFNSTTLNVLAVGAVTPAAATITDLALGATIGPSANNLIVMIWTEGTAAQNVALDVAWELVGGSRSAAAYPLDPRSMKDEIALCQRYFSKSFPLNVAPAEGLASPWIAGFSWSTAGVGTQTISLPVAMAGIPTITFYKPAQIAGTAGRWQWYKPSAGAYQDSTATIVSSGAVQSEIAFSANLVVTGAELGNGYIVQGNWTADAEL